MSTANVKVLTDSMLEDYVNEPAMAIGAYWRTHSRKPPFRLFYVPWMVQDPAVRMSLLWIRGRVISQSKFEVVDTNQPRTKPQEQMGFQNGPPNGSDNGSENGPSSPPEEPAPEPMSPLQQFVITNLERIWRTSINRVLSALEWGFSGHEVIYRIRNGALEFDSMRSINPYDVRPVTRKGKKVGMLVKRVPRAQGRLYIGGMKSFWFVHRPEIHPWFGESKLIGCWVPWWEMWSDGGGIDVRRLYYYKYAFRGDSLYYPVGAIANPDGQQGYRSNKDLAREMVEKRRTGAVSVMPNTVDPNTGNRKWEWVSAEAGPASSIDIRDYFHDLQNEIREGLGVPPEVFQAASSGSGFSGRAIPQEGFDASLQEITNQLVVSIDEQIIQPLVVMHPEFGPEALNDYEIIAQNMGEIQKTARDQEQQRNDNQGVSGTVQRSSHRRDVNVRNQNQNS